MNNAKLIKVLRRCGDEPYDITKPCKVSPWKLMRDAADALEAAEQRIAELEAQLPKEGECDAENVNGDQSDEDKAVLDCSYCPSADGCLEAFSESTLCRKLRRENERSKR